jgi:hypothetical protein
MSGGAAQSGNSSANIARVYDYWLGGHHWLEADRELAALIEKELPDLPDSIRHARRFLTRAVTYVAAQGITQFIDLGSGLPVSPCVHEAARALSPQARVVYADIDPAVAVATSIIVSGLDGSASIQADAGDPAAVYAMPELRRVIDFDEPVCVILSLVLHFFPPAESVQVVREAVRPLASGSYLIVSAGYVDPETERRFARQYVLTRTWNHRCDVTDQWLEGLDVVPPGMAEVRGLFPGAYIAGARKRDRGVIGAVARIP